VFALRQALELNEVYQAKIAECDRELENALVESNRDRSAAEGSWAKRRAAGGRNEPHFDVRTAWYTLLGRDLTQIHGLGAYTVLHLVGECGDDMAKWRRSKHFASCLCLAPGNKVSGGKLLSSKPRRSSKRAATLLRIAAVNVGRTQTALGAFYRRLAARADKAKAVIATARKLAVLFYNAIRLGRDYSDPGADYYEARYRARVIRNLHRRAAQLELVLTEATATAGSRVS
jgi:transposase